MLVCGVDLFGIVAAAAHLLQLLVGVVLDHLGQPRVRAEEVLADVGAVGDRVLLVLAVHDFFHAFGQQAVAILFEQRVPVVAPDHLDNIPLGAAEGSLQFLNYLAIAAHRTVKALQVAVDDPDKVVQVFPRG